MQIWFIIVILFIISFAAAVFALRKERSKITEVENVKDELKKSKILFYSEKDNK